MAGDADKGIGEVINMSYAEQLTIISFIAISLYNVIELSFSISLAFKRHKGLYFWSFVFAAWGIAPYSVGFMLKFFQLTKQPMVYVTLIAIGWPAMVTGQSVVLYSRLHLIIRNDLRLKLVLAMIIVDALICHVPIIILLYGSNSANPKPFITPYSIYEKVQITIFFLQETVISGLYVWETIRILRPEGNIRGRTARSVMMHLIYVNLFVIVLDVALLGIEYSGHYNIQTTFKAAVYSIKLKMEFAILNQLLALIQGRLAPSSNDQQNPSGKGTLGTNIDKRKTINNVKATGTFGYAQYTKPTKDQLSAIRLEDISVVKTTEVTVEPAQTPREDVDSDIDVDSLQGKLPGSADRRRSASSSEIQFAHKGF